MPKTCIKNEIFNNLYQLPFIFLGEIGFGRFLINSFWEFGKSPYLCAQEMKR